MSAVTDSQTARDSLRLTQLCCDVGFSEFAWRQRIKANDIVHTAENYIGGNLKPLKYEAYYCGSASEGVAAHFLGSDTDFLMFYLGTSVIEGDHVPAGDPDPDHIFQMVPTQNPVYCRLQLLSFGHSQGVVDTTEYCIRDEEGRFVLCAAIMKDKLKAKYNLVHGPALTFSENCVLKIDQVIGLRCRSWPKVAAEWITRWRPYNWPSAAVVKEITDKGCELVAVGNHESAARHLEWRLSTSLAEKTLIRSFNMSQIRCYFLLKLVLVYFIKPVVPDALCSYHIKHVMLNAVETIAPAFWTDKNLTNCLMTCLATLRRYLESGNCPHYFIPQRNLFYPKVKTDIQRQLVTVISDLESEGWEFVARCPIFNTAFTSNEMYSLHTEDSSCRLRLTLLSSLQACIHQTLFTATRVPYIKAIRFLMKAIEGMASVDPDRFPCKELLELLSNNLKCCTGYILLYLRNIAIPHMERCMSPVLEHAQTLIQNNCETDVASGRLKLATFLYQMDQKDKCLKVVQEVLGRYTDDTVPFSIPDSCWSHVANESYCQKWSNIAVDECLGSVLDYVAFPVTFSGWEIPSAPTPICELANINSSARGTESACFFVDPLVYAYFLLVKCLSDLGRPVECREGLERLARIVQNPWQYHLSWPNLAMQLFRYSVSYSCRGNTHADLAT